MPLGRFTSSIRASQQAGGGSFTKERSEHERVAWPDHQLIRIDDGQGVEGVAVERELHAIERETLKLAPPLWLWLRMNDNLIPIQERVRGEQGRVVPAVVQDHQR